MEQVGVKELKSRLAHYLRIVREGRAVVVTVRGEPVARLVPLLQGEERRIRPGVEERMWKLVAKGTLAWNGRPLRLPEPVTENRGTRLLSELVIEDRE